MEWNCQMIVYSEFLVYVVAEGISVKESQFVFKGFEVVNPSYWHMSFDLVGYAFCKCISSKVKIFCSMSVNLEVCMFDHGIKWLLSFNHKSIISLRDAVTGPILSLTTNHVCALHSLDLGHFYPMIWIWELLLTAFPASVDSSSV